VVNQAPVAAFTSSCTLLVCTFDAGTSSDDVAVVSYAWTFGDTTTGSGVSPSRTYTAAGTYSVTLTVTDGGGLTNSTTKSVTVTAPPPLVASFSVACVRVGDTKSEEDYLCTFNASGSTGATSYAWNFDDRGATGSGMIATHTYTGNGKRDVTLTVSSGGRSESRVVTFQPKSVL
jgi:PKD repeat protein